MEKKPLRAEIRELVIGSTLVYPIRRMSVVKSTCSTVALENDRKFSTSVDREERTITVTRTR